ncbi:hypothetical protein [Cryobacterium sp. PH31-O1]|uniref:hypothetical protein n=1 Tax=Cryobacterium sp. PH31-O1 TaxID=3046306 RepID=UPI0024B982D5|nr:hypothetical protein [Cryobacterium sp. PH31-O1]MDJ0338252.1 hypothetical protein [Cryobacterium sp. PH31-O1]
MFEALNATSATRDIPAGWRPASNWDGSEGEITSAPRTAALTDFSEILLEHGHDPDLVEVVGNVRTSRWQSFSGEWLTAYRFTVRARQSAEASHDLPALLAAARRKPRAQLAAPATERATVVVLADLQIGKTGSRGGTPELIERLAVRRAQVDATLKKRKPSQTVLVDAGDLFEGFESGAGPAATAFSNDLSLTQQMDLAGTTIYDFADTLARHAPAQVMAVPSNHTAWRAGKQTLGKPADDLGLYVHRQAQRLAAAAGLRAQWNLPADWDESLVLDVLGTGLGVTHGHQYGPGGAAAFWAKQTHGGQVLAHADLMVTGHYHHLRIEPTGRNPYSGRSKWWLQAPTLDAGSDWFRHRSGDDSDPGMLVFDITPDGLDLGSLTIL